MPEGRRATVEGKNPFEERTRITFKMLRNREVNIDDMSLSELKSYFTMLAFSSKKK